MDEQRECLDCGEVFEPLDPTTDTSCPACGSDNTKLSSTDDFAAADLFS